MKAKELRPDELYRRCSLDAYPFDTTEDLEPLEDVLGQPRAIEAIRLAIEIKGDGYNVFALGHPGTGKRTLIRQFLEQRAPNEPIPADWCYVNNFEHPDKPIALELPAGKGPELSFDIDQLLEDVRTVLPRAFESTEFRSRRDALQKQVFEGQQGALKKISDDAEEKGIGITWTPTGFVFNPMRDGEPLSAKKMEKVPEEERKHFETVAEELQEEIISVMKEVPRLHRQARKRLEELNQEVARQAFEPLIDELKRKYEDLPKVVAHLDAVERQLMEQAISLIQLQNPDLSEEAPPGPMPHAIMEEALLTGYRTNVLMTHEDGQGAPIIYEENPTFENLIGRIEYESRMGNFVTDFNLIKPGSLHRANGGYLIIDAHRLFASPFVWEGLKRALRTRVVRIESPTSGWGLINTVSLDPEPIPLDIKVILLGSKSLFYLLQTYDPDFSDLIKVAADFSTEMERGVEEESDYARLIATLVKRHEIRHLDRNAVQRVIEHSSRVAGDTAKLSVRIRAMVGLLRESSYWTQERGEDIVSEQDVQHAIDAGVKRSDLTQERIRENVRRGVLLIDTSGEQVGQVNGLSVFPFGDLLFGMPTRITARTRLGDGSVVDIEREIELGGPTHSKGILILQGFLTGRYARNRPFALTASLVFEQTYGGVEGDSASCAELFALLSSIAELPLKQSLAVTGSVNQHGDVQAIGAVNEKIEGYFDVCRERGLDGTHGVLIPVSNTQHLMLRDDVIDAVKEGTFHIHPIATVDEGIEILIGIPAGALDDKNEFPEGTFNAIVTRKLLESAALQKDFSSKEKG